MSFVPAGEASRMKPPPDRCLDIRGTGADLPPRPRPRYGVRWMHVFVVATALGAVVDHAGVAVHRFAREVAGAVSATLVILNFA